MIYINPWMFSAMIILLAIQTVNTTQLTYEEFLKSTPNTFGLLTVTHARNGVYSYFKNHLDNYAKMDCKQMTEISVVWNNDKSPQQAGFVTKPQWKRPVYFIQTPHNSMDFRYLIPKQSQASVFFSMDDDVITSCQQLRKSFQVWKQRAIGDIGPIISYGPRGFDFTSKTQTFKYTDPLRARFYSISLIGVAWVSRFFFDLYNAQTQIWQIYQMRQIVRSKNNCDDIALNFIVSYFFPQLIPVSVGGNLKFVIHPNSQGLTKTHYSFRNECLKKFIQILGYNPLRLVNKADQGNAHRFVSQSINYIVYLRRKQLYKKYLLNVQNQLQQQNEDILQKKKLQKIQAQKLKYLNQQITQTKSQIQQLKNQLSSQRSRYQSLLSKNKQLETKLYALKKQKNRQVKSNTKINSTRIQLINTIQLVQNTGVMIGILVFLLLVWLLVSFFKRQQKDKGEKRSKINSNQVMEEKEQQNQDRIDSK